jgi:hypothetical protein
MINLRISCREDHRGDPFQSIVNYLRAFFDPAAADGGLTALNLDYNSTGSFEESQANHEAAIDEFVQRMCQ